MGGRDSTNFFGSTTLYYKMTQPQEGWPSGWDPWIRFVVPSSSLGEYLERNLGIPTKEPLNTSSLEVLWWGLWSPQTTVVMAQSNIL